LHVGGVVARSDLILAFLQRRNAVSRSMCEEGNGEWYFLGGKENTSLIVSILACVGLAAEQGAKYARVYRGGVGIMYVGTAVKDISSFACHLACFCFRLF
jgi:hypothetical protein